MPIMGPEHDLAHPVEGDEAWSESYYFNAYDPVTDSGIFTRIGVRPNEGTMDVGLSVWLPDGRLAEYRFVREQREMVEGVLEVGGVRYELVEPMRRWHLTADVEAQAGGDAVPIALDVTFDSLIPAVGVDAQGRSTAGASSQAAASVGKGHLEQAGRWAGTVEVARTALEWGDARGNRDKSWGPRRWGGPKMWRWFSINVGDDVHFGGIRIGTGEGDLHRGWVWKDGAHTSVREWRVRTDLADDGLTHRVVHLTVVDKADREHVLTGDVMRVAAIGHGRAGTVVNEGLTRWEYEGRTGYGIAEYLHQFDDAGNPVVPVE
ncbi:MAG TPA: hypothetical protein VM618_09065 [Acidimicrobiia bacterium]|nr:hypothetical protein [Acidimicrobiia bacterium]